MVWEAIRRHQDLANQSNSKLKAPVYHKHIVNDGNKIIIIGQRYIRGGRDEVAISVTGTSSLYTYEKRHRRTKAGIKNRADAQERGRKDKILSG